MKQLTARLGEEKINKLLVNLSLPATIGMMVTPYPEAWEQRI
jgi:hypothetical protein